MKNWSEEDTKRLIELKKQGKTRKEIGEILGRGFYSVKSKLETIEMPIESAELKSNKNMDISLEDIGEIFQKLNIKLKDQKLLINYPKTLQEHTSILDLSDLHIGSINRVFDPVTSLEKITYNYNIFKKELGILQEAIFRIHNLQSNAYNLKKLYINLLGDIITNDRIYRGQEFAIENPVGKQIWIAVADLSELINNLKAIYQEIIVTGIVGNHGRSTPEYSDEPVANNYEYLLYKALEQVFKKDNRIKIIVPETREYILEICGWRHLLTHGDLFRGSSENYVHKQIRDLALSLGEFDVLHFGHFHTLSEMEIGDKILIKRNGCFIESDVYALRSFKSYSTPKQWIFGTSKGRKECWSYKIDLRG